MNLGQQRKGADAISRIGPEVSDLLHGRYRY
jgi:hypothetical protein